MKWIFGGCPFFGILVKEGTCPACGFPWSTDGTRDHVGVPEPEHPSRTLGYGLAKCLSPVMRCWEITPCYAGIQTDTDPAFTTYPSARCLHPNLCKFISATHRRVRNQPDTHRYDKIATPTFPARCPKPQPPPFQVQLPTLHPISMGRTRAICGEVCRHNGW